MYKVFIYNRPVTLGIQPLEKQEDNSNSLEIHIQQSGDFGRVFKSLHENKNLVNVHAWNEDIDALWQHYTHEHLKVIQAAGGVVRNRRGEYLFIFRLGCWDLPKGKAESGESMSATAAREVEEECGIDHIEAGEFITSTYHTYEHKGRMVLKETHWYQMEYDGSDFTPQIDEDITAVSWISKSEFPKILQNTYASIAELMSEL